MPNWRNRSSPQSVHGRMRTKRIPLTSAFTQSRDESIWNRNVKRRNTTTDQYYKMNVRFARQSAHSFFSDRQKKTCLIVTLFLSWAISPACQWWKTTATIEKRRKGCLWLIVEATCKDQEADKEVSHLFSLLVLRRITAINRCFFRWVVKGLFTWSKKTTHNVVLLWNGQNQSSGSLEEDGRLPRKSSCQFRAVVRSLSVRSVRSSYSLENKEGSSCIFDSERVASRPANNEYDPPRSQESSRKAHPPLLDLPDRKHLRKDIFSSPCRQGYPQKRLDSRCLTYAVEITASTDIENIAMNCREDSSVRFNAIVTAQFFDGEIVFRHVWQLNGRFLLDARCRAFPFQCKEFDK